MKKLLPLVSALAIVSASCGSPAPQIDSDFIVAEVMASVSRRQAASDETTLPPVSVPPGCRLVTVLDEYDFEVEVVDCGEPADPASGDSRWLGSGDAAEASKLMREALLHQHECGAQVAYERLRDVIAEAPPKVGLPLLAAVAALERGAEHCNVDRDAWASEMIEAILRLEDFVRAAEEASGK